jgi:dTDP-4-amino-4,6-dideoxygalactose transaminase
VPVSLLDINAQHDELDGAVERAVARVLRHGRFVGGPEVEAFESDFAAFCGTADAVGVGSGTEALRLALIAGGVQRGDEVVTTASSFVATAAAIIEAGAIPVLVDPDPDTGLITPEAAAAAIGERTTALLPVHLWGQTVDLAGFRALAGRHGLLLVEDAAQAHGARSGAIGAGAGGQLAAFSFYPGKNLGALGEAGIVTTSDPALAARLRRLRDHGRDGHHLHVEVGVNARLDTIQAAALAAKLPHLARWNARRREIAGLYDAGLAGVAPIVVADPSGCVYHHYVVRIDDRDSFREALAERGVESGIHYPVPLHQQPALRGRVRLAGPLLAAEQLAATIVSLPVHPTLATAQVEQVIAAVEAVAGATRLVRAAA